MNMGTENLVGLMCHENFHRFHESMPPTVSAQGNCRSTRFKNKRVREIWDEVFFKLSLSFDGLVTRKKVFSESSYCIETHMYVVVEFLEVKSIGAFEFCLDGDLPFSAGFPPSNGGDFLSIKILGIC